mmetsp:Transcript_18053/g.61533  ORF Transcript_18053/g.61533 Transcript_18053/m.61533 type:complete len:226 (-) Transcript_18053:634-1311(-)
MTNSGLSESEELSFSCSTLESQCSELKDRPCSENALLTLARMPGASGPTRRMAYVCSSSADACLPWANVRVVTVKSLVVPAMCIFRSVAFVGSTSTSIITVNSLPSLSMRLSYTLPPPAVTARESSLTTPTRSGPVAEITTSSESGLSVVRRESRRSATGEPAVTVGSATSSFAPRIAERTHVHTRLVVATTGMRIHIGEKAKFKIVGGTQIFHSAKRSSLRFAT